MIMSGISVLVVSLEEGKYRTLRRVRCPFGYTAVIFLFVSLYKV
jgi:hypothetical protein